MPEQLPKPSPTHDLVTVTRSIGFTAAHYYSLPELSEAENKALFGPCSNREGHGHNYLVEVAVQGAIDPETGMVINLKDLKGILEDEIYHPLDHQNLNKQVPFFKTHLPTLENIALYLWQRLQSRIMSGQQSAAPVNLLRLRVEETDTLFVEFFGPQQISKQEVNMLYLSRRFEFAAAHRLYNPEFSDEKNWEVFRQCNNPNGHGHNYELEVTICGEPDPKTGMLINLLVLDEMVKAHLIQAVDHKNLNLDVDFLKEMIPTAENLAVAFWDQLAPLIPAPYRLHRLRLQESKKNATEYYGPVRQKQAGDRNMEAAMALGTATS